MHDSRYVPSASDIPPSKKADIDYGGDISDVWVAGAAFAVIVLTLLGYVFYFAPPMERGSLILAGAASGTAGWALGILATPYNNREEKRLGRISTLGYAALTGYALGKLDRLIEAAIGGTDGAPVRIAIVPQLAVATTMLLAASVLTYVTRSYDWSGQQSEKGTIS